MPPSQDGSGGSTAEEQRLLQRASSQGGRASQSEARPASQARSSQVLQFHKNFLHFHHDRLAKEESDRMLAGATGQKDAFWRPSVWYLNILWICSRNQVRRKWIKMDRFLVRMEKFIVRMEKIAVKIRKLIVCSWQIWSCYLEAVPRGLSSGRKERA
jgi:hypothetical protein